MTNTLVGAFLISSLISTLSNISEFSERLRIPLHIPIETNQVVRFYDGELGAYVALTNRMEFWVEHGIVCGYRSPSNYYALQKSSDIPKLFGPVNITPENAVWLARDALRKLGYDLRAVLGDADPQVTAPPRVGTNFVSCYRIEWAGEVGRPCAVVDLSGVSGEIWGLRLFSPAFWRAPASKVRAPATKGRDTAENKEIIVALNEGTVLARRLGLPLDLPLDKSMVEDTKFNDSPPSLRVTLTNQYCLYFALGYLRGYSEPESFYRPRTADESVLRASPPAAWNLTTNDAIILARHVVQSARLTPNALALNRPPDDILIPMLSSDRVLPRYYFIWRMPTPGLPGIALVETKVEVDASAGRVLYLYVWDGRPRMEMKGGNHQDRL